MKTEISKQYDPKSVEDRIYGFWQDSGFMAAQPDPDKKPYTIVIPPPNVTDRLHMGHAFNNTIQDMLIRFHKMRGFNALWIPGTDHAGIATQNVVERQLKQEQGKTRHDIGREAFVDKVWEWRERHGSIIIDQLKKLGCACDWSRLKFTMDEDLSRAVTEAFVRLHGKGLIYRGKYIVNWCPRCQTAISDEEVDHQEKDSSLWYVKYDLKDTSESIVVATTRPETILGDTAVAVNPSDTRYEGLIGKSAILPVLGREIPIIADELVDPKFGTGAVKVTPAHDPNDFEIGQRHQLPSIVAIGPDGSMNQEAGPFEGLDRFECRKRLVESLEKNNQLQKVEKHRHSVGHCHRCSTVVEPYLSEQWFVRIQPLSEPALNAVEDGRIELMPERWVKVYKNWMINVRDWCISRQLWWGHRIPVYYCQACDEMMVLREKPEKCSRCESSNIIQDPDVLDTWFSSWLWPFSTMGWPEETEDQEYFFPTSALVTGPDIIFFWVARMIMSSLEFKGTIPFRYVYFNGIIRDATGQKMSKSRGNGIDPLKMIDRFSADAVRYSLVALSSEGQDINLSENNFEIGRNFANKTWNAFRFLALNLEKSLSMADLPDFFQKHKKSLELPDAWILSRYAQTVKRTTKSLEEFRFSQYLDSLYTFFRGDFCDWYLELIKPRLYDDENPREREIPLAIATFLLKGTMLMLHPLVPFISEEIWQALKGESDPESVMASEWPTADREWRSHQAEAEMAFIQEIVSAIRNIRSEMNVPPGKKANAHIKVANANHSKVLSWNKEYLCGLGGIDKLKLSSNDQSKPAHSATAVVQGAELYIPLEGLIDIDVERERLEKEIARLEDHVNKLDKKLSNQVFLDRAPKDVIEKERIKKVSYEENLQKLRNNHSTLNG